MKRVIYLMFFVFLSCFALAENLNPTYLTTYNLSIPCKLNGNDCPSDVSCDLTVWYPNNNIMLSNEIMSYNEGYYNYTINASYLNTIGTYKSDITCNNSEYNASYIFYLEVTKKPILSTDSNFVSESKILTILIALIIIFIALGVFFSIKDANLKYLFFIMAIVTIDAMVYFGYTVADSISSKFTNVLYRFYLVMLIITVLMLFLMLIDYTRRLLTKKKNDQSRAKDYYGDINKY